MKTDTVDVVAWACITTIILGVLGSCTYNEADARHHTRAIECIRHSGNWRESESRCVFLPARQGGAS